jgi:hypothetical protein
MTASKRGAGVKPSLPSAASSSLGCTCNLGAYGNLQVANHTYDFSTSNEAIKQEVDFRLWESRLVPVKLEIDGSSDSASRRSLSNSLGS